MGMTKFESDAVRKLENFLNYKFKNKELAVQALTPPRANKVGYQHSYEPLEFLGDRVLNLCIAAEIRTEKKKRPVGQMHELYMMYANNAFLADTYIASRLRVLLLNIETGWPLPAVVDGESRKLMADVIEAIFGAVFVDSDYDFEEVLRIYRVNIHIPSEDADWDPEEEWGPGITFVYFDDWPLEKPMPPSDNGKGYMTMLTEVGNLNSLQVSASAVLVREDEFEDFHSGLPCSNICLHYGVCSLSVGNDDNMSQTSDYLIERAAWQMLQMLKDGIVPTSGEAPTDS